MNPELSLLFVGLIAKFLLRSTLAFVICLILNRLVTKANTRFFLWAGFLYGSASYWAFLAGILISHRRPVASSGTALAQNSQVAAHSWATVWPASLSVPQSWDFSLSVALGALAVAYGLAILWVAISHANKLRRLRWVMGFATEPPAEIADGFQSLARNLGIRPPRLRVLSGALSPATFGWMRPVVMLPAFCIDDTSGDLEDILLHELHHVQRRDAFWNALGTIARTLICFHPAAWYAMGRMRIDRELACDLAVVSRSPARKEIYAESLLRFARLNVTVERANWGIDFAAPADHLTIRVHSILGEVSRVAPWLVCLRAATALALLAVFVGVVPSLAILLAYTQPLTQQAGPLVEAAAPVRLNAARIVRNARGHAAQAGAVVEAQVPASSGSEVAAPAMEANVATAIEAHPVLPDGPGPRLQRRSSAATPAGTKSQTIPLIDDGDSGKSGKHGDTGQAMQQSATVAAAIWKRMGDLDRH
jgi:beta-lactamase regulating signal transducer with metallopeptidase domain